MSVISLSSEDEDEFIILNSDDEDFRVKHFQPHQVFIVEENKSNNTLKILAEKLAHVLGKNSHSDTSIEQCDKANQEISVTNLEKTILDVSKGHFTKTSQEMKLLGSRTSNTSQTSINRFQTKRTKGEKKAIQRKISKSHQFNSNVKISEIQTQSIKNQSVQIVSKARTKVHRVGLPITKCIERERKIMQSQSKVMKNQPKRPLKISKNIEKARHPITLKQILDTPAKPAINFGSFLLREAKNNKSHKSQSPVSGLESINQSSVMAYHELRQIELKQDQKDKNVLKSRTKSVARTKSSGLSFSKNHKPYDNKLKFTFDKNVSVYSVSVVSPLKPQPSLDNITMYPNDPNMNNVDDPVVQNSSSCQKNVQLPTKGSKVTKPFNDPSTPTEINLLQLQNSGINLMSCDFRSWSIPFCNMPFLKSSFMKYYNIVFDDKIDLLCVEMGYLLFKIMEESEKLQNFKETPHNNLSEASKTQQPNDSVFGSSELKTAVQTCQDALLQMKRKFIDHFSQIYEKINLRHTIGSQLKIVLLTAWFMKMILSITTKCLDLIDVLHDIKTKCLDILSNEIVRWPLICKTFIKDLPQFELDCKLVLDFIKDSVEDQNEMNSFSNTHLGPDVTGVKSQTVANISMNEQCNKLPKVLQHLEKMNEINVSVIVNNQAERKSTNSIDTCKTDTIQSESNKRDYSVVLSTELGVSNDFQSPKKSSREPLQKINFSNNLSNASFKTHFQNTLESNYIEKKDKSFTTDCETFGSNNTAPPSVSSSEDSSKEVLNKEDKVKKNENNRKPKNCQKIKNIPHLSKELPKDKQHDTVQARTSAISSMYVEDNVNYKMAGKIEKYNMDNFPILTQSNCKQIQQKYLKDHVYSTEFVNPFSFSSGHELNHQDYQQYAEAQIQAHLALKQTNNSNVFLCTQSENQYDSNYINTSRQQTIQSGHPNFQNYTTDPSYYSQNQYHSSDPAYYQESSAYQNRITIPTTLYSFQDNFFPKDVGASNFYKQQFPDRNSGGAPSALAFNTPAYSVYDAMSNKGIVINNYNITNCSPHISPETITNYNNPTLSNHQRTDKPETAHLSSGLYEK